MSTSGRPARPPDPAPAPAGPPDPLSTLLFHKPYGVLSQFTPEAGSRWGCLADHIPIPAVYAAGRLDADSEGLLLLTGDGLLQQRLTDPRWGHWRRYWVQVEGTPTPGGLQALRDGVPIQGQRTLAARARSLEPQEVAAARLPERTPPIRHRLSVPTAWLELELREGRNRQVRRMTAAVGWPTLRLVRVAIDLMDGGPLLDLEGLAPGQWRRVSEVEQERLMALRHGPRPQGTPATEGRGGQGSPRTSRGRRRYGLNSPGRGGRDGGGKSGWAGGGG